MERFYAKVVAEWQVLRDFECRIRVKAGFRKHPFVGPGFSHTDLNETGQARNAYTDLQLSREEVDLVLRQTSWSVLKRQGAEGKAPTRMQTIYTDDTDSNFTHGAPTDLSDHGICVKQGRYTSPLLGLFLDELGLLGCLKVCPGIDALRLAEEQELQCIHSAEQSL